ncbi:3-hydroxyacyl-CoA dehydrogenase type-2 [Coleophoma crateriformis]|uniref:3-hydroxyacyl-CoA dehydrogenase type-2 n=1 Tax=Coleophoma crateriformis TaxID=565419 RepID=A0A3D8T1K3_9HELO|nr:3-hydroxyacyl-CoA dehydrogenase type-2 [Coleophoma crateriformis]
MTAIPLEDTTLALLKDKVVVISGGARGIGAATVSQLYRAGARVVFGDWDDDGGEQVKGELLAKAEPKDGDLEFVKTDVTDYSSVVHLFEVAFGKHGRVDMAFANAGIVETGDWFDPSLDLQTVQNKPSTRTIDVNLTGVLYFARVAVVFLQEGAKKEDDKSMVLVSSTAGFKESPGLFAYSAAKHGVLGLLRALRVHLRKSHGIRVNAICPWMTDTVMVEGIRAQWMEENLPVNQPGDVGRVMIEVGANSKWHGRAVFVEGGRGWDIDEGIDRTEGQWMGEELSRTLAKGQAVLDDGIGWAKRETKVKI